MAATLPPLLFEPILKEKVWGGQSLKALGKAITDAPTGESWEIADLASTSASGGGGDAARSVASFPEQFRGQALADIIASYSEAFLGKAKLSDDGGFPLLVKYLDAQANLSVQVHPSPEYAAANEGAHLKTESWYIVDAAPGAVIYKGVKEGVTREEFAKAIEENRVEELLISIAVGPGDLHHLPSGTCHALGAGIVVAEVQTPSDTTYRVYDWGRQGRELHIEQSLECIEFGPPERIGAVRSEAGAVSTVLESNNFYELATIELEASASYERAAGDAPVVWMCTKGSATVECPDVAETAPAALATGTTCLLPATTGAQLVAGEDGTTILQATVQVG